jgi:hypothetical protein
MKKLIVIVALAAAVVSARAASVDWNVSATSAEENYTVYLLTSIADSYADVDALASAAVGSAQIKSLGRGKYGTGDTTSKTDSITVSSMSTAYFAIVASADASSFKYVSAGDLSGYVYNPDNQETSPGKYGSSAATILAGTSKDFGGSTPPTPGPSDVPEPTSGLLVLLGVAGLALRRRA